MTAMLDVVLGLTYVFLVLSLLASAVAEAIEHVAKYRAEYLRQGIEKLLLGGNAALMTRLYDHPLIKSLYVGSAMPGSVRTVGPSYIPSRQFALALLDLIVNPSSTGTASATSVADVRAAVTSAAAPNPNNVNAAPTTGLPAPLLQAMRTLTADAGDDLEALKKGIQDWFDGSMDRVAGWYKRRAQFVLLIVGFFVAIGVHADTLNIVDALSNDSAVRASVVAAAENYARSNPQLPAPGNQPPAKPEIGAVVANVKEEVRAVTNELGGLGLPVGWRMTSLPNTPPDPIAQRVWPTSWDEWMQRFGTHLLGWLLTAFAISFGAPFWFDTLNKIMVIRSTVKPKEKSQDEGSEDRSAT